ncbi:HI1506-related protein [Pseudomonas sp. NPDC077186]|uniref:HI1506-related protein n=1 Tax=Pseudomonas sp. NPDC077186 TaxID=3364421 RepID=UPI0037C88596
MIVRIKSKRDGYRRCGISHPRLATDHPAERFTDGMLEKLQADPVLTVELIDGELPGPAPESSGQGGDSESGDTGSNAGQAGAKPALAKPKVDKASAKPAAKKAAKPAAKPAAPAAPADTSGAQDEQTGEQGAEQQGGEA